ncbi:MAG: hypothetical protein Q9213_000687 [Squamulea squamosa]
MYQHPSTRDTHFRESWKSSGTQVAGPEVNNAVQHGGFAGAMVDTTGSSRSNEKVFHPVSRGLVKPKLLNSDRQSMGLPRQEKRSKSQISSTLRPDMTKQTAPAGISGLHVQNVSRFQHSTCAAIPYDLEIFLGSETNKAIQKIMEAVADTTVTMEQRLTSITDPCEAKLEQLLVEAEHASQKLKSLAKNCEAAMRSLQMEQRKLILLASRLRYVEAMLGIGEGRSELDDQCTLTEECATVKPDSDSTPQDHAAI